MKSFMKAVGNPAQKLFKKATHDTNKFFKKDGQFVKGVGQAVSGIGSASRYINKGVNIGNKILDAASNSPFGKVLSPMLTPARAALGGIAGVTSIANAGRGMLKDVVSGKGAGQITSNILERAKVAKDVAHGPAFA